MANTKQRRTSDDAQIENIAQPSTGCSAYTSVFDEASTVDDRDQVLAKPSPQTLQRHDLFSTETGASVDQICSAFGRQPHSAQAVVGGLHKCSAAVERIIFAPADDSVGALVPEAPRYRIDLADRASS